MPECDLFAKYLSLINVHTYLELVFSLPISSSSLIATSLAAATHRAKVTPNSVSIVTSKIFQDSEKYRRGP